MRHKHQKRSERGVVLIIVLISLTLLCTIGILMMLNAGTESLLNRNYRSSTRVYYAALSGLEEARGRMWALRPDSILPQLNVAGTPVPVTSVFYIVNGNGINPTDLAAGNIYADTEYQQEFGKPVDRANVQPFINSNASAVVAGLNGPSYQWVRITPVTEFALNINVDGNVNGGGLDNTTPLYYYKPSQAANGGLTLASNNGSQAFELTALAVLPDRSRKMLQYVIAPASLGSSGLAFSSALTLDGPVGQYAPPLSSDFWVNGTDQSGGTGTTCSPLEPPKYAVGVLKQNDYNTVVNAVPPGYLQTHYAGAGSTPPSVAEVSNSLAWSFQDVNSLNGLVQNVTQSADYVVQPVSGQTAVSTLPGFGSPCSPVTTVVQGDLTLTESSFPPLVSPSPPSCNGVSASSATGYGLLVVTGNLSLSGDVSWNGIILVIGQGTMTMTSYGYGKIVGAVVLANTTDTSSNPKLRPVTFNALNSQGNLGFYYNSCWVNAVQKLTPYKALSFREIPQ